MSPTDHQKNRQRKHTLPAIQYIRCRSMTTVLVGPVVISRPIVALFGPANCTDISAITPATEKAGTNIRNDFGNQDVILQTSAKT